MHDRALFVGLTALMMLVGAIGAPHSSDAQANCEKMVVQVPDASGRMVAREETFCLDPNGVWQRRPGGDRANATRKSGPGLVLRKVDNRIDGLRVILLDGSPKSRAAVREIAYGDGVIVSVSTQYPDLVEAVVRGALAVHDDIQRKKQAFDGPEKLAVYVQQGAEAKKALVQVWRTNVPSMIEYVERKDLTPERLSRAVSLLIIDESIKALEYRLKQIDRIEERLR